MNYKHFFWLGVASILLGSSFLIFGETFPQGIFKSPIKYDIVLSGTYGELRPNHFHAGIDIKSPNGQSGADIVAAADGYVSRIKVRSGGYGNAIYMNHPNGYTTVYGHLSKFSPAIQAYVKKQQYRKESFSVDLHPPADKFRFHQGEAIAKMGNTGTSSGPHLHFEIRDRRTEEPLNPLRFGLPIKDDMAPKLHKIKTYLLTNELLTFKEDEIKLVKKGNKYHLAKKDTLAIGSDYLGLAIKAFDHMPKSRSWNGIFGTTMRVDGQIIYRFEIDRFSFSDTRYVNAHLDYDDKVLHNSTYHRLYALPGNRLKIYDEKNGVVRLNDNQIHQVEITVSDALGNHSDLIFWVRQGPTAPRPAQDYNYIFPYNQSNDLQFGELTCSFPANSFYENLYFKVGMSHIDDPKFPEAIYQVHQLTTPIQRYFNITLPAKNLTAEQRSKAFIAWKDKKGKWQNAGGKWEYNQMKGRVRALGDYTVMVDNTPPTITPKHFKYNMAKYTSMSFKVTDDFPTTGTAKSIRYRGTVDGQWVLFEFRNNKMTYTFDHHVPKGKHTVRIVATDALGNETVLEKEFVR